jgi:uncharacterized repeat protein (TIGR01451 family)
VGLAPTTCYGPTKEFETPKGKAEICLFKFNDLDGDGVRDLGESGLPGWTFNINPGPPSQVTTGAQGRICFGVSAPGTYTITEIVQSGWTPTTPNTQTVTVPPSPVNVFFGNKKKEEGKCDLELKKSLAHMAQHPPFQTGQQVAFEIYVTNLGNGACSAPISVNENFSAGLTYVSGGTAGWVCTPPGPIPGPSSVTCSYNLPLAPGQTSMFLVSFIVTGPPPKVVENCASVKHPSDTNMANNRACLKVPVEKPKLPDLTIKKKMSCPGPTTPQGTKCTITFTIANNGPGTFNGILVLSDVLTPTPSNVSWAGGSTPTSTPQGWGWSCGLPLPLGCATTSPVTLAPSGSTTFSIDVYIPAGQYENCASVKGYTQFPYTSSTLIQEVTFNNNKSCVPIQVTCDREIKKTVTPNPVQSGQTVTITLTVTNVGTAACPVVPGINVADPQPLGLTFQPPVSVNRPGWSCGISGPWPGVVTCTATSPLLPGPANAVTITFTAKVTAPPGSTIQNCAEVTNVGDANQTNNKSCVTIQVEPCKDVTLNLSTGVANWTVSPGAAGVTTPVSTWVQPSGGVRWIQPSTAGSPQTFPAGNYQYSVPFTLPGPLSQYATITLSGKYAADNSVQSVSLNGGPSLASCTGPIIPAWGPDCFSTWHSFPPITAGFAAGNNHLDVMVGNNPTPGGGPTYTGLVVDATLRAVCKKIK